MSYKIIQGDNRDTLKTIPDNTIDAIVTDPPYGIDFLGKSWDANTGALETYQECLRVLKPGGHILAFSAARTYHHLAVTLEQAGFEIRDQIMWIYSSGFPKSQDIGRSIQRSLGVKEHYSVEEWEDKQGYTVNHPGETYGFGDPNSKDGHGDAGLSGKIAKVTDPEAQKWEGWGTALKPAHEPIALARKPIKQSIAKNCQKYGVGALNIDACRVPYADLADKNAIDHKVPTAAWSGHTIQVDSYEKGEFVKVETNDLGRFPSNVVGEILQADYQKYFYCPKVSRRERHIGFDKTETLKESLTSIGGYWCDEQGNKIESESADGKLAYVPGAGVILVHGVKHEVEKYRKANNIIGSAIGNNHPTVKPVELMKYLIKLITPLGGTVLDPFNGSGSTGCAAVELGHPYIGCELDPAYVEIAEKRIAAWMNKDQVEPADNNFNNLFEEETIESTK
jgi:DNA modification methylase